MNNETKDVITLIELLKMASDRRGSNTDQILENELFSEDLSLLEMWPEACRRTGVGRRAFPLGVIDLWKQNFGRVH